MNIPLLVIILYMIAVVVISIVANNLKMKKGDAAGYLIAGRSLPAFLVAVTITGAAIGGASTIGVAENAYTNGLSAGWYNVAWALSSVLFAFILAERIRKLGIVTVNQIITKVFGKIDGLISSAIQIVVIFGISSMQFIAGGAILGSLLPDYFTTTSGTICSAVLFITIALFGGYFGATITNVINVFFIYFGVIVAAIALWTGMGGGEVIFNSMPPGDHWLSLIDGVGLAVIVGWVISMLINSPPNQAFTQVSAAAKDAKAAKRGLLYSAILTVPIGFIYAFIGILAAIKFPGLESATLAMPSIILLVNPVAAGLVLAGLWAADVSTCTALLLEIANISINDIVKPHIKPDIREEQQVRLSKIIIFVTGVLGVILALNTTSILNFITQLVVFFAPYAIIIVLSIYLPNLLRKRTALVSVIVNTILMLIWMFVPQSHIVSQVAYLSIPVTVLSILLVRIFDNERVNEDFFRLKQAQ